MEQKTTLVECPRDALQGYSKWVPTEKKIAYYQSLLKVGFSILDCGSFVSPKAVPQMADTAEVINGLDCSHSPTQLLTIVANVRGAEEAVKFDKISYIGYPLSISENFQMRNTGKTIHESIPIVKEIIRLAKQANKQVVVYLSMGFGNPYGDPWSPEIIVERVHDLEAMGIQTVSLSDTVGSAQSKDIYSLFTILKQRFPLFEFGTHFHTHPHHWREKMNAAYRAGCRRFDGTIMGRGGCPMAADHLVGNMPTEKIISFLAAQNHPTNLDLLAFESAYNQALTIFE